MINESNEEDEKKRIDIEEDKVHWTHICYSCGEKEDIPIKCKHCNRYFCIKHHLPESHHCEYIESVRSNKEDSLSKETNRPPPVNEKYKREYVYTHFNNSEFEYTKKPPPVDKKFNTKKPAQALNKTSLFSGKKLFYGLALFIIFALIVVYMDSSKNSPVPIPSTSHVIYPPTTSHAIPTISSTVNPTIPHGDSEIPTWRLSLMFMSTDHLQ